MRDIFFLCSQESFPKSLEIAAVDQTFEWEQPMLTACEKVRILQ